jgi:hypothetical protein
MPYFINAFSSASFATTSSFALNTLSGGGSSISSSWASSSISASYALTASYTLNSNQSQTGLSRAIVSENVASIAPNQNYTGSISLGKTFMLLSTQVNTDVRLRLYGSQSYVNSDLTRPIGTDPANNSAIITDLILSGSPTLYNYTLSPIAHGANMDPVTVSTIYYTVTNLSGTTTDISMSFNRIVLE